MAQLIGTAGHVDHGKTALIRALTGIDADRLPEEKRRGMTIDLGFAYIDLPKAGRVSIVDVPGHEKFLRNMLAGALGIDVALLCVAADEGPKPQTIEHLQILELLPVSRLAVALTRSDLVDDAMLGSARLAVESLLAEGRFAGSAMIATSTTTGLGLNELRNQMDSLLMTEQREPDGLWYMPIDRVFTVKGHGCVATGTLANGPVCLGDQAIIEPGGLAAKIKSLHSHGESLQKATSGSRTALNLAGIKQADIRRGQAIGLRGALFPTRCLDAKMRWLHKPKHAERLRLSIGTEEVIGRVFLSDLEPDKAQFRLEQEIACALNQPLIARRYSPPEVLGGGSVFVPQGRPRRKSQALGLEAGGMAGLIELLNTSPAGVPIGEACRLLATTPARLGEALKEQDEIRRIGDVLLSDITWSEVKSRISKALLKLHALQPAESWIRREAVLSASDLPWHGDTLDRIVSALAEEGVAETQGSSLRSPGFTPQLTPKQHGFLMKVSEALEREPINVLSPLDLSRSLGVPPQAVNEILRIGSKAGLLFRTAEGLYYTDRQLALVKLEIHKAFGEAPFTVGEFRDATGSSRKYAVPLLELLDVLGFTLRVGEKRVIRR